MSIRFCYQEVIPPQNRMNNSGFRNSISTNVLRFYSDFFMLLELGLENTFSDIMFLLGQRKIAETAELNYDRLLMKRALKWLHIRHIEGKSSPKQRARSLAVCAQGFQDRWRLRYFWLCWIEGRQGDHLYQQLLLKRSCKALREVPLLPF